MNIIFRDLFEELLVELEEGSSQDQRTIVYSPYDYSRVYRSKDPAVIDVSIFMQSLHMQLLKQQVYYLFLYTYSKDMQDTSFQ